MFHWIGGSRQRNELFSPQKDRLGLGQGLFVDGVPDLSRRHGLCCADCLATDQWEETMKASTVVGTLAAIAIAFSAAWVQRSLGPQAPASPPTIPPQASVRLDAPNVETSIPSSVPPASVAREEFVRGVENDASPPPNATRTRLERIEAAVEANDTSALVWLRGVNLDAEPQQTSVVIRAVGHLAATASRDEREASARTLARWLTEERAKDTTFARGNVSLLVDALADSGSLEAVPSLIAALDSKSLPLHVETRVVGALSALGDHHGSDAVERFLARVNALPEADDAFAAELRAEAQAAAKEAVARLRGG
jgi:hypothetical protein